MRREGTRIQVIRLLAVCLIVPLAWSSGCGDADVEVVVVAHPGLGKTVKPGALVLLNGSRSQGGRPGQLRFGWRLLQRPEGSLAELSGASAVAPSFKADRVGKYVAELTVGKGLSASQPATVEVTATYANSNYSDLIPIRTRVQAGCDGKESGAWSLCVGSDEYTAPALPSGETAGFHAVVLNRKTLQLANGTSSNQSFGLTNSTEAGNLDTFLKAQTSQDTLVILSSLKSPRASSVAWPDSNATTYLQGLGASDAISNIGASIDAYVLVGIPGLGKGNGIERSHTAADASFAADALSTDGYLTQDMGWGYRFTYGSFPLVEAGVNDEIAVDGQAYSINPSTNPGGGFQVLVLQQSTLAEVSNTLYETGSTSSGAPDTAKIKSEFDRLEAALKGLATGGSGHLVIISTIGTALPVALSNVDTSVWTEFLEVVTYLGGTEAGIHNLGAQSGDNYSLVTVTTATAYSSSNWPRLGPVSSIESSTAKCAVDTSTQKCANMDGTIRGVLNRNNQGLYAPYLMDSTGDIQGVQYGVLPALFQDAQPWDGPDLSDPANLDYLNAYQCISEYILKKYSHVGTDNPEDLRSHYWDIGVLWSNVNSDIHTMNYPSVGTYCSGLTVTNAAFTEMKGDLDTETLAVATLGNAIDGKVKQFLDDLYTVEGADLTSDWYNGVASNLKVSTSDSVFADVGSVVEGVLWAVSSALPLMAAPAPASLTGTGLGVLKADFYTRWPYKFALPSDWSSKCCDCSFGNYC